ncbi:MAG: hypothetical protein EAZ99_18625 [Alphaproteobacteria bacterium]|nr:hemerythrin family protein [Alphaproteobacteria bacterium]TAD87127.1 MAG: hypothetical protein EAZ99_18625 [Alphaproteobacteria bacterium]
MAVRKSLPSLPDQSTASEAQAAAQGLSRQALGGLHTIAGSGAVAGDHVELAHLWDQALDATDAQLTCHLATLRHHLVEHFELEERLLAAADAPGRARHAADHGRLLHWLDDALRAADGGAYETARGFLSHDLPTWFTLHLRNLDRMAAPAFRQDQR